VTLLSAVGLPSTARKVRFFSADRQPKEDPMAKPTSTQFITRTALLLALTVVLQIFGKAFTDLLLIPPMFSSFVVGPLVNLCLLVATAFAGVWSGVAIALIAPFSAFLAGSVPAPLFIPVIALGNLILVLCFALADRSARNGKARSKTGIRSIGILVGAVLKTAWLWGGIVLFTRLVALPASVAKLMNFAFSWPQAFTAVLGGILALLLLGLLEKSIRKTT
jgi:hypothetical protein